MSQENWPRVKCHGFESRHYHTTNNSNRYVNWRIKSLRTEQSYRWYYASFYFSERKDTIRGTEEKTNQFFFLSQNIMPNIKFPGSSSMRCPVGKNINLFRFFLGNFTDLYPNSILKNVMVRVTRACQSKVKYIIPYKISRQDELEDAVSILYTCD